MKRTFCLLCCLLLMAVFGVPARAESGCWYLYTYGAHDFEQTEMRLPTCTEAGYFLLECRICGHNELHMTDSATGHKWQKVDSESYPSTCTQNGMTTYVCDDCSQIRTESVRALWDTICATRRSCAHPPARSKAGCPSAAPAAAIPT